MIVWKYCEISMKALCSSSRLAVMNVARRVGLWRAKQLSCADGGLHFASLHRTWRVKTILLYSEAKHRKPLRVKYSLLQKSGLCMCTMKPFADPRTGAECKVSPLSSYNGYNSYVTQLLPLHGSWDMRQLLPQYVSKSPPLAWIIHIGLMLCVTCDVSRAPYEVYTRSRYSAIPPQPSRRPGQLSKTSSNLIQFMCCGKIGNHKWKAGAVFKKQSYPGWCIVNDWEWKLQARRG